MLNYSILQLKLYLQPFEFSCIKFNNSIEKIIVLPFNSKICDSDNVIIHFNYLSVARS